MYSLLYCIAYTKYRLFGTCAIYHLSFYLVYLPSVLLHMLFPVFILFLVMGNEWLLDIAYLDIYYIYFQKCSFTLVE